MAYTGMNQQSAYGDYLRSHGNRGFDWRMAAPVAGIAALPAIGALVGGAGGGAAAGGAGASSTIPIVPAAAAGKFTLGGLIDVAKVAIPAVTGILGQRSQNKALDRQSQREQATYAEQMQMAREQEAYRRAEADRVTQQEERRYHIEQANRAKELAAAEEERAFRRSIDDYNFRHLQDRDARRQEGRLRLMDFLRMGQR